MTLAVHSVSRGPLITTVNYPQALVHTEFEFDHHVLLQVVHYYCLLLLQAQTSKYADIITSNYYTL